MDHRVDRHRRSAGPTVSAKTSGLARRQAPLRGRNADNLPGRTSANLALCNRHRDASDTTDDVDILPRSDTADAEGSHARASERRSAPQPRRAAPRLPSDNGVTAEMAREWAQRTCAEQGVPFHISDPATIRRVLVLLGRTGCRDERRHRAG